MTPRKVRLAALGDRAAHPVWPGRTRAAGRTGDTTPLIPELTIQPSKGATRHAHSSRYYPHRPRGDLDVRIERRTHRQPRSACRWRHPDARRHRRDVAAHADTQQVTPLPDDYPQPP